MRVTTRLVFWNEDGEKFFGEGPYQLLKLVEETGSLHAGAAAMGMAYSKATKLVKTAEQSLGFPLTVRKIGGKSGGGSMLTDEAKEFMERYEAYRNECFTHNARLYEQYFGKSEKNEPRFGCVIMASGMGKRFGGDKLMAELCGKPVIQYILEITENLFSYRVVVTRNEKVKKWCEERRIPVVYHALPGRNDTIRLGLEALEEHESDGMINGCVFCPADMPFVSRDSLRAMLSMAAEKQEGIFRMSCTGSIGAPALFWRDYFDSLKMLPQGKGGSEIIRSHPDKIYFVEGKELCELWDIDTREDLERAEKKMLEKI